VVRKRTFSDRCWVKVSKYKVSNHCYISLLLPSPNILSIDAVPSRASYRDHNKCVPSLGDVSVAIKNINLPRATSVSAAAYPSTSNCASPAHARRQLEFSELVIQSLIQLRDILHGRDCLLHRKEMLTPSYHPKRFHFGVRTLTLPHPVASFFPRHSHPLIRSLSPARLAGWDQSIVGRSRRVKAKRSLGLGPPITPIATDRIPGDSDDERATTPRDRIAKSTAAPGAELGRVHHTPRRRTWTFRLPVRTWRHESASWFCLCSRMLAG
jgi:hypothetical protein